MAKMRGCVTSFKLMRVKWVVERRRCLGVFVRRWAACRDHPNMWTGIALGHQRNLTVFLARQPPGHTCPPLYHL